MPCRLFVAISDVDFCVGSIPLRRLFHVMHADLPALIYLPFEVLDDFTIRRRVGHALAELIVNGFS